MTAYAGTKVHHRPISHAENRHKTDMGRDLVPDLSRGPCTRPGVDPELFHPVGDSAAARARATLTIATYCLPCPVRVACRDWGRRYGRQTGIWGGEWLDRGAS